jgi:hypothetical protein
VLECQHCGESAPDHRTFCPSCRRRLRPSSATTPEASAPASSPAVPAAEPQAPTPPPWAYPGSEPTPPASSIRLLARLTVAALAAVVAVDIWQIVAELHRASLVNGVIQNPTTLDIGAAQSADDAVQAANIGYLLAILVAGSLFIAWLYQVVSIVVAHRPQDVRHSKGWSIGGWFVPFLNWVRPKQFVDDAWRGTRSDPAARSTVPMFVHVWWALFLAAGLLTTIAARLPTETVHDVVTHDRFGAVGDSVNLLAGLLAVVVVWRLTARMYDERWLQRSPAHQFVDVR